MRNFSFKVFFTVHSYFKFNFYEINTVKVFIKSDIISVYN